MQDIPVNLKQSQTITLRFVKTLFTSKDNFCIFVTDQRFSAKGHILDEPSSLIDTSLEITGYFEKSSKYGETFVFSSYKQKSANYYFLVNMVKGINEVIARDMISRFGDDLYSVIENEPSKLLAIKGIGDKKLKLIISSYDKMSYIKKLAEFLLSFDVPNGIVINIYNALGDLAIDIIKENPYELTKIRGISFKKADSIAIKIGKDASSLFRIKSGIIFTFNNYINTKGDTCLDKGVLFRESKNILNIENVFYLEETLFIEALQVLLKDKLIVQLEDSFILSEYHNMEEYILQTISFYVANPIYSEDILKEDSLNEHISNIEKKMQVKISKEQNQAICLANKKQSIFSICGFAGTGKTTISKIVLELMSFVFPYELIVCCSLSGVASNRIKQLTSYDSFTIHSLLKFKGATFEHNEKNKLSQKVILLDEASMVNVYIFYSLLKAIDFENGAILILVGDIAQLPPIGAGDVYYDIISQDITPYVLLQKVFRQKNKVLRLFASDIRKGNIPMKYKEPYEDFIFIGVDDYSANERILELMLEAIEQYKDMKYLYTKENISRYISYFQIISPIKNHLLGVKNINLKAQEILNPLSNNSTKNDLQIFSFNFRVKDKVIHLKNKNMQIFKTEEFKLKDINDLQEDTSSQKRIFNGQIGVISKINKDKKHIFVYYPIEDYVVWYKKEDLADNILDLGYALSAHKTQGSEFENVLIPITFSHSMMLNTRLTYTMVTRAKNKLILIGQNTAFENACEKLESIQRSTYIKHIKKS